MKLAITIGLVIAAAACGHPAPARSPVPPRTAVPWQSSGVDWSTPPPIGDAPRFLAPRIEDFTLANGIRVLLVENHRLPIIELATLHMAAGSREDGAQPGLAALTVDLLDQGAGARDASELAAALDQQGARLELRIATDYASAQMTVLTNRFAETLEVLADMLERPRFAETALVRVRSRHVGELAQHRERQRTIAAQAFDRLLFGSHAYGSPAEGVASVVGQLTAGGVRGFWQRAYTPNTMTVIVAGDVTRDQLAKLLDHAFGTWPAVPAAVPAGPEPARTPALGYVDLPGAAKTAILIGRRAETTADLTAEVANMVLGGTATARLDRKLRGELAITVGAGSSFWRGRLGGTWAAAATTPVAATADGIHAILALIEDMRTIDVSAGEVAVAKTAMKRAVAQAFETTSGTVRALEHLVVEGLPLDHYATYADRLDLVTPASLRSTIAPLWSDLSIVVVGDWSAIRESLQSLGRVPVALSLAR
ncbi:MAG: peptidase domain protein [Myxococcales bacterium]|nr:peptidase domain protein [Myxococcales bacterium]